MKAPVKIFALMFCVSMLCVSNSFAQQPSQGSEDAKRSETQMEKQTETQTEKQAEMKSDPAKRADIIKMMKLTGADKMAMTMIRNMIGVQRQSNPNVPGEFWDKLIENVNSDGLLELSANSWEKHFTHDEIRGLIKFYQSPLGKKMIAVQPKVMQESMVAGQQWSMSLGRKIAEELQKATSEK